MNSRPSRLGVVLSAFLSVSLLSSNVWAFAGAEGASFLDVPVGAGPAALGSAYSSLANDVYAPVWNPGGLGFLKNTQLGGMHQSYVETTSFEFLSFVHPFSPGHAFGISAQYFRPGDFMSTDAAGNFTGNVDGYYGAYSIAYGQTITEKLALGLTAKLVNARIADVSASAYAGDAGLFYRPTEKITLAAVIANVGTELKFLNEGDPLPEAIRVGGTAQLTSDIRTTLEGSFPRNGPNGLHAGIEWPSEDKRGFCVRTGYSTDRIRELGALAGVTVGAGLPIWGQEFSYAFVPLGVLGASHYFSLIFRFGQSHDQASALLSPKEKDLLKSNKQSGYENIEGERINLEDLPPNSNAP